MKRILLLAFLLICFILTAADETVTVQGTGLTRDNAIQSALKTAVDQKYGMQMTNRELSHISTSESSVNADGKNSSTFSIADSHKIDVATVSKGRIKSYRIISVEKEQGGSGFVATLEIVFPGKYIVGRVPDKLRRMTLARFRLNASSFSVFGAQIDGSAWEVALNDSLNTYITQSRKFTMLDRDFSQEANAELARLNDVNASPNDAIRLGQKLATDYLIVGAITFNNIPPVKRNPFTGKVVAPGPSVFATIHYRVILAPTGQLKWSDSVQVDARDFIASLSNGSIQDSAEYAAELIGGSIISSILPYEIVGVNPDNTIIIGEGGKTFRQGDLFSVYNLGEDVTDSRTGEVIDAAEIRVGMVRIIRTTEKLSYAVVVEGKLENMQKGSRLRRDEAVYNAVTPNKQQNNIPAPAGTVQTNDNGGVVVPF